MRNRSRLQRTAVIILLGLLLNLLVPIIAFAYSDSFITYFKDTHRLSGYVYSLDPEKVSLKLQGQTSVTNVSYGTSGGQLLDTWLYDDQNRHYYGYRFDVPVNEEPAAIAVTDGSRSYNLTQYYESSQYKEFYDADWVRLDQYRMPGQQYFSDVAANTYLQANAPIVAFTPQADNDTALRIAFPSTVTASAYIDFSQVAASDFVLTDTTANQSTVIDNVYDSLNFNYYDHTYTVFPNIIYLTVASPFVKNHTYKLAMSGTSSGNEIRSAGVGAAYGSALIGKLSLSEDIMFHLPTVRMLRDNIYFFDQGTVAGGDGPGGDGGNTSGDDGSSSSGDDGTASDDGNSPSGDGTESGSTGGTDTSGGGTGSASAGQPASAGVGATVTGTAETVKIGDKTVTRTDVSGESLQQAIDLLKTRPAAEAAVIAVDSAGAQGAAQLTIQAGDLAHLAAQVPGAVLQVNFNGASYSLPAAAIDFAALAEQLGTTTDKVKITVAKETLASDTIPHAGLPLTLVGSPVDFTVTAEAEGRQVEIHSFDTMVKRTIELPSVIDAAASTVLLYDPATGELRFVPATFETKDGRTTVTVRRNGNSIYTVAQLHRSLPDVKDSWAKEDIDLLLNKGVLDGVSDTAFAPQAQVTRAQFAAMLVRSLGLSAAGDSAAAASAEAFSDVRQSDWFAQDVAAAVDAKLVSGYEDRTFRPNDPIAREEMAAMFQRALQFAGRSAPAGARQPGYTDAAAIDAWALPAVQTAFQAGILTGKADNKFEPRQYADRAETATALSRFMRYAQLIN